LGYPAAEGRSPDTRLSLFAQSQEPLDRLKVVTVRNMATHAGRSVSAGELNGLCEVLFGGRVLEGMIELVGD
jgi:hypothetical protein